MRKSSVVMMMCCGLLFFLTTIRPKVTAEPTAISFNNAITIADGQTVDAIAVGDFNQDGRDDFAAIKGTLSQSDAKLLHWYEGDSMTKHVLNAPFFPDGIKRFPGAADAADLDNDGDIDLIFGNAAHGGNGAGDIIWFENPGVANVNGDWPYHVAASFVDKAGHMNDIDIDDIDGDGKLDIVMRHLGSAETLRIVFQDNAAADQWTVRSIGDLTFREGMGVDDMDSDGDPDILMNGYWLETPDGDPRVDNFVQHTLDDSYFTQPFQGLNNSTKQAFGDIDGDGKTDVVLSSAEGQSEYLAWFSQPANATVDDWPRVQLELIDKLHTVQLADFDNDGDLDIFGGRSLGSKGLFIWENQNNGATFVKHTLTTDRSSYTGRVADFDGDGDLDIVAQDNCCGSSKLYWLENLLIDDGTPPTTPVPPTPMPTSTPPGPTPTPPPAAACTTSPTALYTFSEGSGSVINDVSGVGSPFNLSINSGSTSWVAGRGLTVTGASRIESAETAQKIIAAAKASDALTIELWIEPANVTQDGPARIVSLSQGGSNRNVMVGQGRWASQPSDVFDVRLRTSDAVTNDDGKPAVTSPSGSARTALTQVIYSRDANGNVTIYVDGQPTVSESRIGTLDNWDDGYKLGLANEFGSDRPWLGTFYELGIFACAFSAHDALATYAAGLTTSPTAVALGQQSAANGYQLVLVLAGMLLLIGLLFRGKHPESR